MAPEELTADKSRLKATDRSASQREPRELVRFIPFRIEFLPRKKGRYEFLTKNDSFGDFGWDLFAGLVFSPYIIPLENFSRTI